MLLFEMTDGKLSNRQVQPVSFSRSYDVVVCGLGTSGAIAAITAARHGLSVLGIEAFNCPGGTTTIGGIMTNYFGNPGGIHMELDNAIQNFTDRHMALKAETGKIILQEALLDSGCKIWYESTFCGIYREENTVVGLRVITPDGLVDVACHVLMDCTGDGLAAHMAGCASEYGRELDGLTQPYTMVSAAREKGRIRTTNFDFGRVDPREDWALSKATLFSRAYEMREEREGQQLLLHMPLIGIRECRRIIPAETVRSSDILAGRFTQTPMFYAYADLDKHGWDIAFDGATLGDWSIGANLGAYNVTVPVPYLAIVPKDTDGLLVPCRALGVDRDISSCVRMIPDMKKAGEAAAHLAMLSLKLGCPLRSVPYTHLKELLLSTGCLNPAHNRGLWIDGRNFDCDGNPFVKEPVSFPKTPDDLPPRLATRKPGQAIWAAKQLGEKAVSTLLPLLQSEDELLRKHAALALAATGHPASLPVLREMVTSRDTYGLKDCRKNNQRHCHMAIYWLGILEDAEIADVLMARICDPDEHRQTAYTQAAVDKAARVIHDFNEVYFQYVTQSVMALIRIGNAHPSLRPAISDAFGRAFGDDAYYFRFTTRPKMSSEGTMVLNIRKITERITDQWQNLCLAAENT